jgi:DNA-binding transcriptional MerR regulator
VEPIRDERDSLYTIGELARRSGVSVKTIRHYSDVGVLPPSQVTRAGYRLYSEEDRSRLELVRTLRAAGFDLPTITRLVGGEGAASEALKLQAEALDLQLRTLKRRRALLESALGDGAAAASYPDRARALGLLEAREREAFLTEHLERSLEGVPIDPDAKAWFWQRIVSGMPEELDDEQLEAWAELAQLASDETFVEALREQTKPVWEAAEGSFDSGSWNEAVRAALEEAARAVREGRPPTGERERAVVEGWIHGSARAMGKQDDPHFARWMLSHYERTYDPRMERYWELIAILKGWNYDPTVAKAYRWLIEGLR